jgi:hypothetical protein
LLVVPGSLECARRSTLVRFVPGDSWQFDTVILVGLDSNDCIRTTTRQDFAKFEGEFPFLLLFVLYEGTPLNEQDHSSCMDFTLTITLNFYTF